MQMSKKPHELKPDYSEYLTHLIKLFNNVIEQSKLEEETMRKIVVSQTITDSLGRQKTEGRSS
jgi:hypothetical protein